MAETSGRVQSIVDPLPVIWSTHIFEAIGITLHPGVGVLIPKDAISVVTSVRDDGVAESIVFKFLAALVQVVPAFVDAAVLDVVTLMSGGGLVGGG